MLVRVYSRLLGLFPREFRDEFGYQMLCDFEDAMNRIQRKGSRIDFVVYVVWHVRDLVQNAGVQWMRSRILALLGISACWTLLLFGLIVLQGTPQTNPHFLTLHLAWIAAAALMMACSIAIGRYHSRRS